MVDITKCTAEKCKKKKTCYRYLAKDSYRQVYFRTAPSVWKNTKRCKYYITRRKHAKRKAIVRDKKTDCKSD